MRMCRVVAWRVCDRWRAMHLIEEATQEAQLGFIRGKNAKLAARDFLRTYHYDPRGCKPSPSQFRDVGAIARADEPAVKPHGTAAMDSERLMACLAGKPRRWTDILTRIYWNGETKAEIARETGVTHAAIARVERDAIAYIRQCMSIEAHS